MYTFEKLRTACVDVSSVNAQYHIVPELFDKGLFFVIEPVPYDMIRIHVKEDFITTLLEVCKRYEEDIE